eukprot:INCI16005.1.p1 GENE.INCI16005.1~~INCI16005.1.p1  ORF type:complete len:222 (+),score=39.96 INCI16005.1:61-726(+)
MNLGLLQKAKSTQLQNKNHAESSTHQQLAPSHKRKGDAETEVQRRQRLARDKKLKGERQLSQNREGTAASRSTESEEQRERRLSQNREGTAASCNAQSNEQRRQRRTEQRQHRRDSRAVKLQPCHPCNARCTADEDTWANDIHISCSTSAQTAGFGSTCFVEMESSQTTYLRKHNCAFPWPPKGNFGKAPAIDKYIFTMGASLLNNEKLVLRAMGFPCGPS